MKLAAASQVCEVCKIQSMGTIFMFRIAYSAKLWIKSMASRFTIYSINQLSYLIYQIPYIIYKISDISYKISYIHI